MRKLLIGFIKAYQLILSPYIGQHCRFTPTCSCYAIDAIDHYGPLKGGWMGIKRLLRCHPWAKGGYDPVPEDKHHSVKHHHG
jgi:putative membrane protein insertion efficiency factor